ncbi:microcephalin isoform X5 [Hyperolius riggenbachi]|uniref:microcephalin isoform X5 n=1 Tax=Hyperolius riggenbachi TaxID=752182 RepID=UPI0035A3B924
MESVGSVSSPTCGDSGVLTGVIAFVDVWSFSKTENYSQSFSEQLLNLGAKVAKRLNKQVTHVVFKDGSQSTWDKAVKHGIKLVSVLWVDKCRETATHVDESIFPAIDPSEGMPPNIIKKKRKCMQPKDLVIKTPENDRRLAKKFDKMLKELEDQKTSVDIPTLSFDDDGSLLYSPIAVIADRCNAMEKRLQEMRDKRENLSPTASQMSQTAFDIPCLKPSLGNSPSVMPESPLGTESKTSGSDAISGVSEMFNEQRHKCTEESRKTEKSRKVTRSLVMTSMSSEKQNTVIQVVKKFGGFTFSDQVCESTTHVISGNPRRTLNIIFGIARGCWIVSYDWILWSLERGHWLPEEPYELSDHFPGATICRLQRHLSAGEYYQDFLSSVPPLFIAPSSEPPCDKLSELVQLCGGKLCKTLRQAKICIGLFMGKKPQDMQSVSEKWLLDSISQHKLHPLENYLLAL